MYFEFEAFFDNLLHKLTSIGRYYVVVTVVEAYIAYSDPLPHYQATGSSLKHCGLIKFISNKNKDKDMHNKLLLLQSWEGEFNLTNFWWLTALYQLEQGTQKVASVSRDL